MTLEHEGLASVEAVTGRTPGTHDVEVGVRDLQRDRCRPGEAVEPHGEREQLQLPSCEGSFTLAPDHAIGRAHGSKCRRARIRAIGSCADRRAGNPQLREVGGGADRDQRRRPGP